MCHISVVEKNTAVLSKYFDDISNMTGIIVKIEVGPRELICSPSVHHWWYTHKFIFKKSFILAINKVTMLVALCFLIFLQAITQMLLL